MKMNKGLKIGLIIAVIVIVGIFTVIFKQYYDNTYVGSDYYLQVPSNQDTIIDEWQSGSYTIKGKKYKFTAYNENGEGKIVKIDITDDNKAIESEEQLLQPNTYIKVNTSKNRVISWEIVQEQDIPEAALKYINENHK
jgi:uncharacterized protein (TIGR01655 family)